MPTRGNRLSFSEVKTVLQCSAKWKFQYLEELPYVGNADMAFGSAIHSAIASNFSFRIQNNQPPPVRETLKIFHHDLAEQLESVAISEDDDHLMLEAVGDSLIRKYFNQIGDELIPIHVEHKMEAKIQGISFLGYPDLIVQRMGRPVFVDLKTVSKTPQTISEEQQLQLTIYSMLYQNEPPYAPAEGQIHFLNKSTLNVNAVNTEIVDHDYQYVEKLIPSIAKIIMSGVYFPNRTNPLCSKRFCPFWQQCQEEFSGQVKN